MQQIAATTARPLISQGPKPQLYAVHVRDRAFLAPAIEFYCGPPGNQMVGLWHTWYQEGRTLCQFTDLTLRHHLVHLATDRTFVL